MKFLITLTAVSMATNCVFALTLDDPPGKRQTDPLTEQCRNMLELQLVVYKKTRHLNNVIEKRTDKKLDELDKKNLFALSKKQKMIRNHVTKTIAMLKAEGNAVAFREVFELLSADMKLVENRLRKGDAGPTTQAMENDIILTLEEIIGSIKTR